MSHFYKVLLNWDQFILTAFLPVAKCSDFFLSNDKQFAAFISKKCSRVQCFAISESPPWVHVETQKLEMNPTLAWPNRDFFRQVKLAKCLPSWWILLKRNTHTKFQGVEIPHLCFLSNVVKYKNLIKKKIVKLNRQFTL